MIKYLFYLIMIILSVNSFPQHTVTVKDGKYLFELTGPKSYRQNDIITVTVKIKFNGYIVPNNQIYLTLHEFDTYSKNDRIGEARFEFDKTPDHIEKSFSFKPRDYEMSDNVELFAELEVYTANVLESKASSKSNLLRLKRK